MTPGLVIVLAAVVSAVAFGLWRGATNGRFAGTHPVVGAERSAAVDELMAKDTSVVDEGRPPVTGPPAAALLAEVGEELGERVTLLQFSSAFCAPCRATRRTLEDVAAAVPGVAHVEVDAEHHLDATRTFRVMRTPTTLVLDSRGNEVSRASGAPRKEQVLAAVASAIDAGDLG